MEGKNTNIRSYEKKKKAENFQLFCLKSCKINRKNAEIIQICRKI